MKTTIGLIVGLLLVCGVSNADCCKDMGLSQQQQQTIDPTGRSKRGLFLLLPVYSEKDSPDNSYENARELTSSELTNDRFIPDSKSKRDASAIFMRHADMLNSQSRENDGSYVSLKTATDYSTDDDVSAEVTDNVEYDEEKEDVNEKPSAIGGSDPNYDPNHEDKEPKVIRMAEPTKFNIPFANNVNMDQRVLVGEGKNNNKKYRIYPLYQNPPMRVFLKNPSYAVYQHDPWNTKDDNRANVVKPGIKPKDVAASIVANDNYMDECIGIYGPEVCATLATADQPEVSREEQLVVADDGKNEKSSIITQRAALPYAITNNNNKFQSAMYTVRRPAPIIKSQYVSLVQNPKHKTLRSYSLQNEEGITESTTNDENVATENTSPSRIVDGNEGTEKQIVSYSDDRSASESKKIMINVSNGDRYLQTEKNYKNHVATVSNARNEAGTELSIQSVDERPSFAYESDSKKSNVDVDVGLRDRVEINNNNKNKNTALLFEKAVKKVINNFVPGRRSSEYIDIEALDNDDEDLLPEILDATTLKNLLAVPEVEDLIVDAASKLLVQIVDSSFNGRKLTYGSIRKSLRNVVDRIPHPNVTPNVYNQWVTERVALLDNSDVVTTTRPPREIFEKIERIVGRSALDERAANQPIVRNLIVKAVKHSLDRERGIIDEFTVRRAFDLLVKPRTWVTKKTPYRDDGYRDDYDYYQSTRKENRGYASETTPTRRYSQGQRQTLEGDATTNHYDVDASREPTGGSKSTRTTERGYRPDLNYATTQSNNANNDNNNNRMNKIFDSFKQTSGQTDLKSTSSITNSNPVFMGRLLPVENDGGSTNSQDPKLVFVGDGVRLPLTMKKLQDGSYALTLADELCKRLGQNNDRKCPLRYPINENGGDVNVRERRSGDFINRLSFMDDGFTTTPDSRVKKSIKRNKIMTNPKKNYDQEALFKIKYNDQNDEYLVTGIPRKMTSLQREMLDGPPYRYQRYAEQNKSASTLKNVLHWMKNVIVSKMLKD